MYSWCQVMGLVTVYLVLLKRMTFHRREEKNTDQSNINFKSVTFHGGKKTNGDFSIPISSQLLKVANMDV